MFYSQCLLSRKGPLGAIWVAAYCFKRLKKAQVNETDISYSVDKIMQDAINDQTYRVLAYLLLGLVRIYSKKVEYLFHDCNEVLVKIKRFKINTKNKTHVENLCTSITLPNRFELDAFDLDVIEDVGGGNIAPRELITLKDVPWKNEQIEQFPLEKYQSDKFDGFQGACSADYIMVEYAHQSHPMDIDFEVTAPSSPTNLLTGNEKFQGCTFSPEEPMKLDTEFVVEEVHKEPVNLSRQDKPIDEEQMTKGASYEDEVQDESSIERIRLCIQEDIAMFFWGEEDLVFPVEPYNETHQTDDEKIQAKEREDSMDHDKSSFDKDKLKEQSEGSNEEYHNKGKLELQENYSVGSPNFHIIQPKSINVDVTPESRFEDASVARPKPGATTPDYMLIPTPAAREGARFSRKRKLVFDDMIVLPNEVVRRSLYNARDLVSKRRKCPQTPLEAWRASLLSSLPEGFHGSLVPCHSLELQSLFSRKKMKISESLETLEIPGKLDDSESQAVSEPDHIATAPKTPPRLSTIRPVESSDNVTPSTLHESIEREQSLRNDEELNLMKEDSNSSETENPKSCAWTGRTKKVAMHLQRSFVSVKEQSEEEVVKLSQVLGEKSRKECARLFYEILVLKTTNFVDVEQIDAYGDISLRKLPKLDQTYGVHGF